VLVDLADTERSTRLSANWKELEQPLGAYRRIVDAVDGAGAEEGDAP
jgi:hypothetical protein